MGVGMVLYSSQEYCEKFYNRTIDMINLFHRSVIFDDTALPLYPISDAGLKIASHFYNTNMTLHNGKLEAVLFGKVLTSEQKECMVWDVERGIPDEIQNLPWQTCTCIGEWHYKNSIYENNGYKSAKEVIHMLIDIVSKNGNLLLSIPVKGDGTIDEKKSQFEVQLLDGWISIKKVYLVRVHIKFLKGPSAEASNPIKAQGFNENKIKFTSKDIRFNQKGNVVYVTIMGIPEEDIIIKNLGSSLCPNKISKIELLGCSEKIKWQQNVDYLKIGKPSVIPNEIAVVFKVYWQCESDLKNKIDCD